MEFLLRRVRYAVRVAGQTPLLTGATLLVLAIGVGATTAVLSLISEVLFPPSVLRNPAQLFRIAGNMSVPNGLDLAARASTIESLALVDVGGDFSLTDVPEPRNLLGATVTTNFLQTFGAAPALGRDFVSEEQRAGQNDLVILTWTLWQRAFKGDPAVVGRGVRINNRPVRVIGILPAEFRLGDIEIFRPLVVETERDRRAREFLPFVRLKRDVTRAQAEANLVAIGQQLQREYPAENDSLAIRVVPIEDRRATDARRPLFLLLTAAVFLLLIACVNVANLLLALGVAKRREYALRTALGCAASRLVVEVVVDCVVVFLVGGLLGVLLAAWSQDLLTAIASPYYGVAFQPRLDWRVLACSLALSTVIGVLSGLAPALQARRAELQDVLKGSSQAVTGSRTGRRLGNMLVVGEVALAFILLVGTGLLIRSIESIYQVPLGFETTDTLVTGTKLPKTPYSTRERQVAFIARVMELAQTMPSVHGVGVTSDAPIKGAEGMQFVVDGRPRPPKGQELPGRVVSVTADYFRTLGIPIRRGRSLRDADVTGAQPIVVISETTASRYFANEEPIGQRIRLEKDPMVAYEIVGVVADVRQLSATREFWPIIYRSFAQVPDSAVDLIVRVPRAQQVFVAERLRSALRGIDSTLVWEPLVPMQQYIARRDWAIVDRKFLLTLLAAFAAAALAVSIVGIYGTLAYAVAQQRREIGIRLALGASRPSVIAHVVRRALTLMAIGLTVGILGAIVWARLLESTLFGVTRADITTFVVVSLIFIVVAVMASYWPARHAAKIDPLLVLRAE